MNEKIEVKIGQVWRSWDSRSRHYPDTNPNASRFRVVAIDTEAGLAIVIALGRVPGRARRRFIKLERFRPTSTGYKLLENVNVEEAAPAALLKEAAASVALDKDPDCGTHSVDDGCPGGHREEKSA